MQSPKDAGPWIALVQMLWSMSQHREIEDTESRSDIGGREIAVVVCVIVELCLDMRGALVV